MIVGEHSPDSPKLRQEQERAGILGPQTVHDDLNSAGHALERHSAFVHHSSRPQLGLRLSNSPAERFWKAFAVAVVIWILLCLAVTNMADIFARSRRHFKPMPPDDISIPFPEDDANLGNCSSPSPRIWHDVEDVEMETVPFSKTTSIDLPVSSALLFLLARGENIYGSVDLKDDGSDLDLVRVDVVAKYYTSGAIARASVCKTQRGEGNVGVGIFASSTPGHSYSERIQFHVTVHIPFVAKRDQPLVIHGLETQLPLFTHTIGDLKDSVWFKSVSLNSGNSPITVESIHTDEGKLMTTNSPIHGHFRADRYLKLETSNAAIQAEVSLYNGDTEAPTEVVMKTKNSPIESTVILHSRLSNGRGGSFLASADTSNGHLTFTVPSSPLDSTLKLQARSSNSPVTVNLPPTYEGFLSMKTSNGRANLDVKEDLEDPAGKGRRRNVWWNSRSQTSVSGSVRWGGNEDKEGNVEVKSSNSPVYLKL